MNRRLLLLLAVAALLGAWLVLGREADAPRAPSPEPPAAPAPAGAARDADAARLNPLSGLDPQSFAAIAARPLFNPGRRPRPAEPPPPPPVPEPPPAEAPPQPGGPGPEDYKLLAVSSSAATGRIAALRVAATGEVLYVRQGQSVDRWQVLALGERDITIGAAEGAVTLTLFGPQAPQQPQDPPQQ